MSTSAKQVKAAKEYEVIRTSKDGRQYVTVSDVLNSPAGRAEIRRQSENFEAIKNSDTKNGSAESHQKNDRKS